MAQFALPSIDEESGRRRTFNAPSVSDPTDEARRRSTVADQTRSEGSAVRRISSAPTPTLDGSPADVPSDRSRMKIKRQSSSSGLFTGQPGRRSRSDSIAYSYPSIHDYPRHESSTSLDEVFETNENFTFKEVKRKPLDLDPLEFEELLSKRREQ